MSSKKQWELALVYSNGKRYFLPFEIIEKYASADVVVKIKAAAIKEISKL